MTNESVVQPRLYKIKHTRTVPHRTVPLRTVPHPLEALNYKETLEIDLEMKALKVLTRELTN